jgi:hypothetical protein
MVMSNESLAKASTPRHFIALGTAAGRLISNYGDQMDFDSYTIIDGLIPETSKVVTKHIRFEANQFMLTNDRFQRGTSGIFEIIPLSNEIKDYLSGLKGELVFYTCLGNVTGTLLFQSIGYHFKNPSQKINWIATTPFEFEGTQKKVRAKGAISIVKENQNDPICFPFEQIRKLYGNLSIRTAFQKGDLEVLKLMNIDSASC